MLRFALRNTRSGDDLLLLEAVGRDNFANLRRTESQSVSAMILVRISFRFARYPPSGNFPSLLRHRLVSDSPPEFRGPVRQQSDGGGLGVVGGLDDELFAVRADVVADAGEVG